MWNQTSRQYCQWVFLTISCISSGKLLMFFCACNVPICKMGLIIACYFLGLWYRFSEWLQCEVLWICLIQNNPCPPPQMSVQPLFSTKCTSYSDNTKAIYVWSKIKPVTMRYKCGNDVAQIPSFSNPIAMINANLLGWHSVPLCLDSTSASFSTQSSRIDKWEETHSVHVFTMFESKLTVKLVRIQR